MENANVNTNRNNEEDYAKLVFNSRLAKFLVEERGQTIIGLKANKFDKSKVVFIFRDGIPLRNAMMEYAKISRQRRAEKFNEKNKPTHGEVGEGPQQED